MLASSAEKRPASSHSRSPFRRGRSPLRVDEEDELAQNLRTIISLERNIEREKINLAERPDFNLFDAFKIFDSSSRGYVTITDLKLGLHDMGLYTAMEEIDLFLQRYDTNGDRRLTFTEFAKAFESHDQYFAAMVSRRPSNVYPPARRAVDAFLPGTLNEFSHMWRTHFSCEQSAESLRQRTARNPSLNVSATFDQLDLDADGRISKDEILRMLESKGAYVSIKDVDNLVEKFDKNRDGRISYAEWREESAPKSPPRRPLF
jgi:Ca2+-binding EF-hand superfamily protein